MTIYGGSGFKSIKPVAVYHPVIVAALRLEERILELMLDDRERTVVDISEALDLRLQKVVTALRRMIRDGLVTVKSVNGIGIWKITRRAA